MEEKERLLEEVTRLYLLDEAYILISLSKPDYLYRDFLHGVGGISIHSLGHVRSMAEMT